jgi:hypothetical protein
MLSWSVTVRHQCRLPRAHSAMGRSPIPPANLRPLLQIPLSPLFPLDTAHFEVTPLFPLDTKKQAGTPSASHQTLSKTDRTLTSLSAALTNFTSANSFHCHSYENHPGWDITCSEFQGPADPFQFGTHLFTRSPRSLRPLGASIPRVTSHQSRVTIFRLPCTLCSLHSPLVTRHFLPPRTIQFTAISGAG